MTCYDNVEMREVTDLKDLSIYSVAKELMLKISL